VEGPLPAPGELAATALQTYRLPYVQRLLPVLVPELSIWGEIESGTLLAGRVDAIAIEGGKVLEVLDWKSDPDTNCTALRMSSSCSSTFRQPRRHAARSCI